MYTATQQQTTLERRQALLDRQSDLASTITDNEGKLRSIETEKKKLFRSIASGDRTATERADRLDVQELDLQRTLAGFRSELADVDGDLAALVPILQAENARELEQTQQTRAAEFRRQILVHCHNYAARYRAMCRERFELAELLGRISVDSVLTERQTMELVSLAAMTENEVFVAPLNEHWRPARRPLTPREIRVIAAKPPDAKRSLEELK